LFLLKIQGFLETWKLQSSSVAKSLMKFDEFSEVSFLEQSRTFQVNALSNHDSLQPLVSTTQSTHNQATILPKQFSDSLSFTPNFQLKFATKHTNKTLKPHKITIQISPTKAPAAN
jgi:hypothetical protein